MSFLVIKFLSLRMRTSTNLKTKKFNMSFLVIKFLSLRMRTSTNLKTKKLTNLR